ncbi:hypothetical protein AB0D04_27020 [Streptomyces sp. NPDC048483]|uniref:hypothetical protein n=1 Tax=Streptomyces sp. NPDC048483 TaxID=3154927 RepID=UPI0034367935
MWQRALSMSVRTYRRHVAEIMRLLGVKSRFQAGARAMQMRLLGPGYFDVPGWPVPFARGDRRGQVGLRVPLRSHVPIGS